MTPMDIQLFSRRHGSGNDSLKLELFLEGALQHADGDLKRLADALNAAGGVGSSMRAEVFRATQIRLSTKGTLANQTIAANQPFAVGIDVPGVLLDTDANGQLLLRRSSDLANDLEALGKWAEAQVGTAAREEAAQLLALLNDARTSLRRALRQRKVSINAGAQASAFFGATGVAGATEVKAVVSIDLQALLSTMESGNTTGCEVFRADLDARVDFVNSGGSSAQGSVCLSCVITDVDAGKWINELVVLIPRVDLPSIDGFPRLGFDLPTLPFPTLSLDGFALGNPLRLLDLGVPLPAFDGVGLPSIPLETQWTNNPQLNISLVNGALAIITTKPGDARIVWTKGAPQVELASVSGLELVTTGNHYQVKGTILFQAGLSQKVTGKKGIGTETALPVTVDVDDMSVVLTPNGTIDLAKGTATGSLIGMIDFPRVLIRSKEDPSLVLALGATYKTTVVNGSITGRLTRLVVIEPYPVALIAAAAETAIAGMIRLIGLIELPEAPSTPTFPDLPALPDLSRLIERIGDMLTACLKWMAKQAGEGLGAVAEVLIGLIESALDLMGRVIDLIRKGAEQMLSHVAIEVRLDAGNYALKQVLISPVENPNSPQQVKVQPLAFAGLEMSLPAAWVPTLFLDFSETFMAALLVSPKGNSTDINNHLVISTDLWLKRQGAPVEAVRDTTKEGNRPDTRLIQLRGWKNQGSAIAVVVVQERGVSFFKKLEDDMVGSDSLVVEGTVNTTVKIAQFSDKPVFSDLQSDDFDGSVECDVDAAKSRLLPFFGMPKSDGGGAKPGSFLDKLSQYVELQSASKVQLNGATVNLPLSALIHLDDFSTTLDICLKIDLSTLNARLDAGEKFEIRGKSIPGDIFGLTYVIRPKKGAKVDRDEFAQFELDFSSGSPRMVLHKDAEVDLFYSRLGGGGRGLVFKVSEFAVGQGFFDIVADVDPQEPVTLPGVDMPFRFKAGRLVVKRGEIQAFSITGCGQLPPELVGEANCTVTLSLGREPGGGRLAVLACDAELDKAQSPIVCHATRFVLTISKLGFALEDMRGEGGYQFYFQVTGTLVFTPNDDEFSDTFLKNLRGLKITLNKAPLARDISRLGRAIDFHIPIEPKVTFNLFDVFAFELRGIGYLGSSEAFGGDPALVISGQAKLTPNSDTLSAKFNLHNMYISTQLSGTSLPRVRFDGLGVSLALKTGSVEATAITVDDQLPTLYKPGTLPANFKARGFLASGRINLKSWAPMSAAMGFLELTRPDGERRHSFFLYGQMEKLSTEIPTPIKPIYLREIGFGIGYRYTLAGLRRADTVTTPKALIEVLDDVSRYQNDLARFEAWEPETSGDRLTLALRGMLSIDSASEEGDVSEMEEILPNLLLMDVSAALRSDLTFLMTVRAWLCVNYADWSNAKDREAIASHPMLRGYLYLSAPRQEFLARLLSDPNGYIGDHPKLPEPLVKAFRAVTWSATLYVRPGLFHYELGWPYELKFAFNESGFGISCEGGMVMRIEDSSILYGIAFRATGFAHIGGQVGGRSLGASAVAHADFTLDAKFIALIALKHPRDTLFYGSVAFTCTVSIEVRVWMSIDLGFDEIRIEIGLSLSRTISLALEVAVEASGIAARGAASTSFAAFGRTLTLGIGFSFGGDRLEEARQRVARYLALGLTAAVPDPEQGLAPPPAAPPAKSDGTLDNDAEKHEVLSEVASDPPTLQPGVTIPIGGNCVGQPHFWAMLFELQAFPGMYVMQFIPRDHTEIGGKLTLPEDASTFFAFPNPKSADGAPTLAYELDSKTLCRLLADGTEQVTKDITALYDEQLVESANSKFKLRVLLEQCFVPESVVYDVKTGQVQSRQTDPNRPLQPSYEAIDSQDAGAAATSEQAEEALRVASSDMMKLSLKRAEWRATEERRSSVIASVVASAEAIARDAKRGVGPSGIEWPKRRPNSAQAQVDARDLGLTFFVSEAQILGLFDHSSQVDPPESHFQIRAVGAANENVKNAMQPVYLFNPVERFFDRQNPRLAMPKTWLRADGVALDWDLEPGWEASKGIWNDPEFHLKHYEIERIVQVGGRVLSEIRPIFVQTKAGAPLAAKVVAATMSWQRIRPLAQFVDDFADLPDTTRPAFRQQDKHSMTGYAAIMAAFDRLGEGKNNPLVVTYTVVPLDITGKRGVGMTIEHQIGRPKCPETALGRVELVVVFERFPGLKGAKSPTLFLRIDDLLDREKNDKEQPQRLPARGTRFSLKVRQERAVLLGEFGADSLGQALQRPGPAEFARKDVDDREFDLELLWPVGGGDTRTSAIAYRRQQGLEFIPIGGPTNTLRFNVIQEEGNATGDPLTQLLAALGIDAKGNIDSPRPVRIALQRRLRKKDPDEPDPVPPAPLVPQPSPWMAADMVMRIGMNQTDEFGRPIGSPVEAPVEMFEFPVIAGYQPLSFNDLDARAGRLLVDYPAAESCLWKLLDKKSESLSRLRDGERRIATQVSWAALPGTVKTVPAAVNQSPDHIAGYDVFEIDLTSVTNKTEQIDVARHVARVRLLDPRIGKAEPASIEDFGAVEAFYPSEALKLGKRQREGGAARRRAWFSPAESLLAWPTPTMRRSVGLAMEEVDVAALFDKGRPYTIEVAWSKETEFKFLQADGKTPLQAPEFCYEKKAGSLQQSPFIPDDIGLGGQACWTVAAVRKLIIGLVLGKNTPNHWDNEPWVVAYLAGHVGSSFKGISLTLTGKRGPGVTGQTSVLVDLDQRLHPILADVIDSLRWDLTDKNAPYRRYRPVLEAAPATKVTTIAELIDERPGERDPYGWAVLRTLGLAQGLRLFDMTTAAYEQPHTTLNLVDKAFSTVRKRYTKEAGGAPFVDVFTRTDGLMTTASFDGGIPQPDEQNLERLLANEVVCLTQISLRPLPEAMVRGEEDKVWKSTAVRYFAVTDWVPYRQAPTEPLRYRLTTAQLSEDVLIDFIDLLGGTNGGRAIALARDSKGPAANAFARGRDVATSLVIDVPALLYDDPLKPGGSTAPVALLRVISTQNDGRDQAGLLFPGQMYTLTEIRGPVVDTNSTWKVENRWREVVDPFEQFPILDSMAITTLIQGQDVIKANESVKRTFDEFAWYVHRVFGQAPSSATTTKELLLFLERWPAFIGRYLAHGPASSAALSELDDTPFALATIPYTEPQRLVPNVNGVMQLLLLHKDRFARRRRYVVRPVGRYDALVAAWDAAFSGVEQPRAAQMRLPWVSRPLLADSFGANAAYAAMQLPQVVVEKGTDPLSSCSIDVVMPRTEPLATPVILSAGRLDVGTGADRRPGRLLEFVVSRHPDEIASEANIHLADALQFEHQAFGFWREFAQPQWARAFAMLDHAQQIVELPSIGHDGAVDPGRLSFAGTTLEQDAEADGSGVQRAHTSLADRIVDGWRGITSLRTDSVPHFYRLHLAAFAAAGVVVSKPVAAAIPEGHFELRWPWSGDTSWIGYTPTTSSWSLERNDLAETAIVELHLPLVRNIDGIRGDDRQRWITDPGAIPSIFLLPDPLVVYELSTRVVAEGAVTATRASDLSPEVEFLALPGATRESAANNPNADLTPPCYLNRVAGARFTADEQTRVSEMLVNTLVPWRLNPSLRGTALQPVQPSALDREARVNVLLQAFGSFEVESAAWRTLGMLWPVSDVMLIISAPKALDPFEQFFDWPTWAKELAEVKLVLEQYLPAPPLNDDQVALAAVIQYIQAFLIIEKELHDEGQRQQAWMAQTGESKVAGTKATKTMVCPAGVPLYPTIVEGGVARTNGVFNSFTLGAWTSLPLSQATAFDARAATISAFAGAARRFSPTAPGATFSGPTAAEFARMFASVTWAYDTYDDWLADSAPFGGGGSGGGFAPISRAIPADLQSAAMLLSRALPSLPDADAILAPKAIFEFVMPVVVTFKADATVPGSNAAFKDLLTALRTSTPVMNAGVGQGKPGDGFFAALETLAAVEQARATVKVELRLPICALESSHPVASALMAFDVESDLAKPIPTLLILRRPATQADLAHVAQSSAPQALSNFLAEAAADQLFGTSRRLFLKASKGIVDPIVAVVERAK